MPPACPPACWAYWRWRWLPVCRRYRPPWAPARIGAADLGFAGVYGSCVFNITILAYADPFYRKGIVLNHSAPEHFVAGGVAIALILLGGLMLWGRHRFPQPVIIAGLALMAGAYAAGALIVALMGAPNTPPAPAALLPHLPLPPAG